MWMRSGLSGQSWETPIPIMFRIRRWVKTMDGDITPKQDSLPLATAGATGRSLYQGRQTRSNLQGTIEIGPVGSGASRKTKAESQIALKQLRDSLRERMELGGQTPRCSVAENRDCGTWHPRASSQANSKPHRNRNTIPIRTHFRTGGPVKLGRTGNSDFGVCRTLAGGNLWESV